MRKSNGKTGLGTEAAKKMKGVPLSNDVIADGIAEMSCDILNQIFQEIKDSPIRIINKRKNQQMFPT